MQYTSNYGLRLPEGKDSYSIDDFNLNSSTLDNLLFQVTSNQNNTSNVVSNHINDLDNPHRVTKEQLYLDKVENKSSSEILGEMTKENVVDALGYEPLDAANGDIIDGYYNVNDGNFYKEYDEEIEEFDELIEPKQGKIYINLFDNSLYRWDGVEYSIISKTLQLGVTSEDAFRGDYGKIAYDHSLDGTVHLTDEQSQKINLGNEGYLNRWKEIWISNFDSTSNDIDKYSAPSKLLPSDTDYHTDESTSDTNTLIITSKNLSLNMVKSGKIAIEDGEGGEISVDNAINFEVTGKNVLDALSVTEADRDKALFGDGSWRNVSSGSGGGGTTNYPDLDNKPSINNITLSGNKTLEELGIHDTTYEVATNTTDGLLSSTDKNKLDSIEDDANNYIHPEESGYKHIPSGGSSGDVLGWSSEGTAEWIALPTYSTVTYVSNGLMLAKDKAKLDEIQEKATYIRVKGSNESEYHTGDVEISPESIGLEKVGNYKAVSVEAQELTNAEKIQVRENIGAGTSDFSGSYNDLDDQPDLGNAAYKNTVTAVDDSNQIPTCNAVKKYIDNKEYVTKSTADLTYYYNRETTDGLLEDKVGTDEIGTAAYSNIAEVVEEVSALPTAAAVMSFVENKGYVTNIVDDLTNYYLKSETYTKDEINQLISSIPKFSIQVVPSLPEYDISSTTIYLVPSTSEVGDSDLFVEYIYIDGTWERLGSQTINLSDYYTSQEIDDLLNLKVSIADLVNATTTTPGLMSAEDKAKLNTIEQKANYYVHPSVAGYKHIPSGGEEGQVLMYQRAGTAKWSNLSSDSALSTSEKAKINSAPLYVHLQGILYAGETNLILSDSNVTSSALCQVFTSIYGTNPLSLTPSDGSVSLTFDAQSVDMGVDVVCMIFTSK